MSSSAVQVRISGRRFIIAHIEHRDLIRLRNPSRAKRFRPVDARLPHGRATAHPDHRCISSEDVNGTEVYGQDGKDIGEIDHLIIDKARAASRMQS